MKKHVLIAVLAVLVATICIQPAFAATVRVIGKVTDTEGKPIEGAHVVFTNPENGQKYDNKTNSKGEYDRIGFNPGNYDVSITDKDKKPLVNMKNVVVSFDSEVLAFDKAVREALNFAKDNGNTLLIVTTDHGNSGLTMGNEKY